MLVWSDFWVWSVWMGVGLGCLWGFVECMCGGGWFADGFVECLAVGAAWCWGEWLLVVCVVWLRRWLWRLSVLAAWVCMGIWM